MQFHVGQKVVCIVHGPWRCVEGLAPSGPMPSRGGIYVISGLYPTADGGSLYLQLTGFERRPDGRAQDFNGRDFRPVIERETDISVFTQLLTPTSPRKVDA